MIYVLVLIMNYFGEWLLLDIKMRVLGLGLLVGSITYFTVLAATGLRFRHLRAPLDR